VSGWAFVLESASLRHGRTLLAALAVVSAFFALGYARLQWTNDPEVITLEGSDELEFYRGYLERWGSDELIVVAYEVPDAFEPAHLETLRSLTEDLLEIEHVRWVSSLDTAFAIDTGPFGPYARPLVPDRIENDPEIRERALASPFIRDALVSQDGRTVVLSVQLEGAELQKNAIEEETLAAIDAVLSRPEYADLAPHLAGSPVFNRELSSLNQRDNARFTPLAVGIIALLVAALFRSLLATGIVLGVIALVVVWTQGLMSWLGEPMNITTSLLPPLLMVIAVADSIHLLTNYLGQLAESGDRRAALRWTIREIVPPCFWTSATTMCGFASLWLVRIESVRTFATFAVLGVAIAFLLSVTLLPALLVRVPLERAVRRRAPEPRALKAALAHPRPWLAAATGAASLAIGAAGLPRIDVATHDGEFFAEDNPLNRAYRFIEARLQGVTPFEIQIRAPADGDLRSPFAVSAVSSLQQRLAEVPELTSGISYVDLLESTSPGADLAREDVLERSLFLLETLAPDDLSAWLDPDYRLARISARADAMTSARSVEVLEQVHSMASGLFSDGWEVRATGLVPVFSQMEQYLVEGQLRSYGFAIVAIGSAFALIFRSLSIALVALIPNTVPILIAGGLMGLTGMRLDVVTIMVASVALGIIVDDTIHLTKAYLRGLERDAEPQRALDYALGVAGLPVLFTSFILVGGFVSLALSDFQPTAHFGILVGITIATALVADLVILPVALVRLAPSIRILPRTHSEEVLP
jgi:predicted RND superfamily exporter protein